MFLCLAARGGVVPGQKVPQQPVLPEPQVVFYEASSGQVEAFAEDTLEARPVAPGQIQPLPLTLTARDAVDAFLPDLPQQRDDFGGVASIVLPGGGRLVRYQDAANGMTGILHAHRDGVSILLELPLVQGQPALTGWIAVSPFEPVAAVVTDENLLGRGDVYLLRLDGGTFSRSGLASQSLTAAQAAPDPDPESLTFLVDSLVYLDNDVNVRHAPSSGDQDSTRVTVPPSGGQAPVEFDSEIAVSADGGTFAFLAGQKEDLWDVYVGRADGSVVNLTAAPSAYQEVGHTTSAPDGPNLALSADGSTITYAEEIVQEELFRRATDGSGTVLHFTHDGLFEHSIDDGSSIIDLRTAVVFLFGENFNAKDAYRVELQGNAVAQVLDLTGTSGDADGAPWETGARLEPCLVARSPAPDVLWIVDDRTGDVGVPTFDVWTSDASSGSLGLADLTQVPELRVAAGGQALAGFRTASQSGLALLSPGLPADTLLAVSAAITLQGLSVREDGQDLAFVASAAPGLSLALAFDATSRQFRVLFPWIGFVGNQTSYSPGGGVLFTFGVTPTRFVGLETPQGVRFYRDLGGDPWLF